MRNFKSSDFRGWFRKMDPDLLDVIDKFVDLWGKPVIISPVDGAIGRKMNPPNTSFHNFNAHGQVKAIDLMLEGLEDGDDFRRAFDCAVEAGALGIGLYPDWNPMPGVHLDMGSGADSPKRKGVKPGSPAKWSAFKVDGKQVYGAVTDAFEV